MSKELSSVPLPGGFPEPVFDAQQTFRAIMEALANPGRIRRVAAQLPATPVPLAAAACALALCDFETSLYLAPSVAEHATFADYIRFHTEAVLIADSASAAFAIAKLPDEQIRLSSFAQGLPEYPDRSTTLILIVPALIGGKPLRFVGPGIAREAEIAVAGLPVDFAVQWTANRAAFPLGVDILFACGSEIMGLPRSARLLAESV